MKRVRRALLFLTWVLWISQYPYVVRAQIITGSLEGVVRDSSGARLAGATLTLNSPALLGGPAVRALPNDRTHMFRIQGNAQIPNIDVLIGANFQYLTGRPYAAQANVPLPQGATSSPWALGGFPPKRFSIYVFRRSSAKHIASSSSQTF